MTHVDAALAEALIRAQCPALDLRVVRWLGEGYDSIAFDVDGEWVFRFPKRDDVARALAVEVGALAVLAAGAPLAVPVYAWHGRPSAAFPRPFGGYRRIPGTPALGITPAPSRPADIGRAVGRFLAWLHAVPVHTVASAGLPHQPLDALLTERGDEARADLAAAADSAKIPVARCRAILDHPPNVPGGDGARETIVHGDFAAEHVLLDPATGAPTGVIDWTEIAIGHPATDLAGVLHWGDAGLVHAALAAYGDPGEETVACARYLAVCRGVADIVFGQETGRAEYVTAGVRGLEVGLVGWDGR